MPAIVDVSKCNRNWEQCFSARVCPESAFSYDSIMGVTIDSGLCGECAGPCVNFCDGYAIQYDRDPDSFEILRRKLIEGLSDAEVLEARRALVRQAEEEARAASAVIDVTIDSFVDEVLRAELPVVADFWAPWCGPCKAMAPVFEELAKEYQSRAKFVKINTEEEPQLAAQFQITSIPTLLVFQGGQIVDGSIGALPRPQLQQVIDRVVQPVGPVRESAE